MLRIVDNFYKDPEAIRDIALNTRYELITMGNYSGHDSLNKSIYFPEMMEKLKELFPGGHYAVVASRFRSTIQGDTHLTFIHCDCDVPNSGWHVLVYLKKEPTEDGLLIYEHETKGRTATMDAENILLLRETEDYTKFKVIETVPYKYNRAVIVDYSQWHSPMIHDGFGDCIEDSRLMHIIEVCDTRTEWYPRRLADPGYTETLM